LIITGDDETKLPIKSKKIKWRRERAIGNQIPSEKILTYFIIRKLKSKTTTTTFQKKKGSRSTRKKQPPRETSLKNKKKEIKRTRNYKVDTARRAFTANPLITFFCKIDSRSVVQAHWIARFCSLRHA